MNRKILLTVLILAAVLLATPMVRAVPLKFQTFHVTFTANVFTWLLGDHWYTPSMEKVNRLVVSGDETFLTYEITVGSNTYELGEDFTYTGHFAFIFYDVTAWLVIPDLIPPYVWPSEYRAEQIRVDYMYEFLPASGIEGTIQMRAVSNQRGYMAINSLAGTGDLQNVQIKAVQSGASEVPPIYTVTHDGMVSGWPV